MAVIRLAASDGAKCPMQPLMPRPEGGLDEGFNPPLMDWYPTPTGCCGGTN